MRRQLQRAGTIALALAALLISRETASAQQPVAADDGITVQARGPVHEAFAQPTEVKPGPGPVEPKPPPEPIAEEPPNQKPQGDNVQWIPGYWAWDTEKKDYLWVSGTWRAPPPDRSWVPGHWVQADGGWQWVAGFWASATQNQVQYVSEPPASLDNGPADPAPNDTSSYVPGCWFFRNGRWGWRPGYWLEPQNGWVWTPSHYCYTPAGYVFVDGFWDYALENRGLLFAPVSFEQPLWQTPGWVYQPRYCVGVDSLLASLFVWPNCHHYFFGDYYGPTYAGLGFTPWYAYGPRHYDPLFGYARWQHRGDSGWYGGLRNTYLARTNGSLPRPPHTFREQSALLAQAGGRPGNVNHLHMVTPLNQLRGGNARLTTLSPSQVTAHHAQAETLSQLRQSRNHLEAAGRPASGSATLPLRNPAIARPQQTLDTHIAPAAGSEPYRRSGLPAAVTTPQHTALPQIINQTPQHAALPQIINQSPQTYRAPAQYQYQSHYGPSVQHVPTLPSTPHVQAYQPHYAVPAPAHVAAPHWSMPTYQRAPAPVFRGGSRGAGVGHSGRKR